MWNHGCIAIICLIALCVELVFDTSTSFVRAQSVPAIGTLVLVKKALSEKERIPLLQSNTSFDLFGNELPRGSEDTNDVLKFGGPASHVGQVEVGLGLDWIPCVSRFVLIFDSFYREPRLSGPLKPPLPSSSRVLV